MSVPEFVLVRKSGVSLQVNRGEAARYVRAGFELVKDQPIPDAEAPAVVIHDGLPVSTPDAAPPVPVPDSPAVSEPVPVEDDEDAESETAPDLSKRTTKRKRGDDVKAD